VCSAPITPSHTLQSLARRKPGGRQDQYACTSCRLDFPSSIIRLEFAVDARESEGDTLHSIPLPHETLTQPAQPEQYRHKLRSSRFSRFQSCTYTSHGRQPSAYSLWEFVHNTQAYPSQGH
jgi:hypothetical protein